MQRVSAWWFRPNSKVSPFNLGDEISRILLERLFEVQVKWSEVADADFVGAGSVLQNVIGRERRRPVEIVGTGFNLPREALAVPSAVRVHSVRGFLTRESLELPRVNEVSVGDLGLLVGLLRQPTLAPPRYRYGIIPHISSLAAGEWRQRKNLLPESRTIDIRTDDIDGFLQQMLECEVVVSESLHGLVFADALGIPNVWLGDWAAPVRGGSHYKFLDYFSSVGRPAHLMAMKGVELSEADVLPHVFVAAPDRVRNLQHDIWAATSVALSAIQEAGDADVAG